MLILQPSPRSCGSSSGKMGSAGLKMGSPMITCSSRSGSRTHTMLLPLPPLRSHLLFQSPTTWPRLELHCRPAQVRRAAGTVEGGSGSVSQASGETHQLRSQITNMRIPRIVRRPPYWYQSWRGLPGTCRWASSGSETYPQGFSNHTLAGRMVCVCVCVCM